MHEAPMLLESSVRVEPNHRITKRAGNIMASNTLSKRPHENRNGLSLVADSLRFPWVTLVFLTGFSIVALLAGRLWLQMSDPSTTQSGAPGFLLSVTEFFVAPFESRQPSTLASSTTGIFEYSTLVALEAYLIATLVIVFAIVAARVAVFVATQELPMKPAPARKRAVLTLQPAAVSGTSAMTMGNQPRMGMSQSGEES